MHGRVFPLSEEFASHPACRCSPAPRAKGSRVEVETGEAWFAKQDEAVQRKILGPGAFDAYRSGEVALADLVKTTHSPQWGASRTVRALRDVRAGLPPGNAGATRPVSHAPALPDDVAAAPLRRVLDAIDAIHGDGQINRFPVTLVPGLPSQGAARFLAGRVVEMQVKTDAVNPELTFAHELGHVVDRVGAGRGATMFTLPGHLTTNQRQRVQDLATSITDSQAYTDLMQRAATIVQRGFSHGPLTRTEVGELIYIDYLAQLDECFARAYAQYIAVESGDATMRRQLAAARQRGGAMVYHPRQWDDEDFTPIASAIRALFHAMGWML